MPAPEPVDPDVDLEDARQRAETAGREWDVLLAIAIGGVVGAEARYGFGRLVGQAANTWPWATLLINVIGSAVLAALMAVLGESDAPPRLARPFIGVGICGGFTTFSTFTVEDFQLFHAGRVGYGLAYIAASVLACVGGVMLAGASARELIRRRSGR